MIVSKSVKMAVKTDVSVLGMVENMGSIICPHCGTEFSLFAQGQAQEGAENLQLPVLARFPWRQELAQRGALLWDQLPKELQASADSLIQNIVISFQ